MEIYKPLVALLAIVNPVGVVPFFIHFTGNLTRAQRVPMKRFGTGEEVAAMVLFLLSDESRYMTGSEVAVDGGISL